jgi:hypothetical protein
MLFKNIKNKDKLKMILIKILKYLMTCKYLFII